MGSGQSTLLARLQRRGPDSLCAVAVQVKRRLPRVNPELAARMLLDQDAAATAAGSDEDAGEAARAPAKKKAKGLPSLLEDDRFAALFKDQVRAVPSTPPLQMLQSR